MRDEIRFDASKIALEVAVSRAIIGIVVPGFGKIADCRLASESVDMICKIDMFIKFEGNKAFYPANVKTRMEGSPNYSLDEENLSRNTFIIYYEKRFSAEFLKSLTDAVAPDLLLVNETAYILSDAQINEEISKKAANIQFKTTKFGKQFMVLNEKWVEKTATQFIII